MAKPKLNKMPSAEDITEMESNGYIFAKHGEKRIVGSIEQEGYSIVFLEDDTEIMRDPDGEFIQKWPF